jgi:hypothetical protein
VDPAMPAAPDRYTLRDLPLPAKLVVTGFLITVGVGYFAALVQMHFQHATKGHALPTPDDVVEKFSGLRAPNGAAQTAKLEAILSGAADGAFDKTNMVPAFFAKSGSGYDKECKERGKETVDAERSGERSALLLWVNAKPEVRKKAYEDDKFKLPGIWGQPISEEFFDKDAKTVPIKTLIEVRCLKCHGGEKKPDLDEYAKLEPLATAPTLELIDGKYVRSSRQLSVEALTQSTHAHLLSFAVLFSLTGLVFAFTSYPGLIRGFVGPLVLAAQVCDVSCWWLARLPGVGPTFALAIMGTGLVVGLGLLLQIILSLVDLYGWRGRLVLAGLFVAAATGLGVLASEVIRPALEAEKAAVK